MEYKSHKTGSKDARPARSTPGVGARNGVPFTRKPTSTGAKRPYSPRKEGLTRGARKSFDARPDLAHKRTSRTQGIDSRTKPHYVRSPRETGASEQRTYSSHSMKRPSLGERKDVGAKPSFEKKPGAYGYKEARATSRPKTRSAPHARTQSWSQSRDGNTKASEAKQSTSWGKVAGWYDEHLTSDDTYHKKVLLPNILRLVDPKKDETIVDIACGQGYFTEALSTKGATLIGVDISEELIAIARKKSPKITYHVSTAEDLSALPDHSADKAIIMLAIQNIEHTQKLCSEVSRVLNNEGTFHIVMNHPAFRIPKQSSWDYDDKKKVQYRRVDQYISDSRTAIDMHPGMKDSPQTISFHRPLQYYFKALSKAGFAVDRLEEWTSHKESDSGPRAQAENRARKEIPLFLYLRAQKIR